MLIKAGVELIKNIERRVQIERQRLLLIKNGFPPLFSEVREAQILASQRRTRHADKSGG